MPQQKKAIVRFDVDGFGRYELDVNDCDAREIAVLERMRSELGNDTGTVYAVILIARRRGGEQLEPEDVLGIKWGQITPVQGEAEARPPAGRAATSRGKRSAAR